jgi:hypothetical protein
MIAFVALTVVSSASAYLSYKVGADDTRNRCLDGGEFRLVVARSFDDLRRLAIADAPERYRGVFIARTQPAIDRVLSQTAGRTFHVPLPSGRITPAIERQIKRLTATRCATQ